MMMILSQRFIALTIPLLSIASCKPAPPVDDAGIEPKPWRLEIQPDLIFDHPIDTLDDPGKEAPHFRTTVQIVDGRKGWEFDKIRNVYRFSAATMDELSMYDGHIARLCQDIWPNFRSQALLQGRSGTLLADGTILTAGHGVSLDEYNEWFVILARTSKFVRDNDGKVTIPASQVRTPKCVVDCRVAKPHGDWMILELEGDLGGPWSHGIELAQAVQQDAEVVASFHPLGLPVKYSDPVKVAVTNGVYFVDIDSAPGASGGGLIDRKGQLAGVAVGCPISTLKRPSPSEDTCIPRARYCSEQFVPAQSIRDPNFGNRCGALEADIFCSPM
jgi:hypothetical protein